MTTVEVGIPWRDSGCEHRRAAWEWIRAGWAVRHPEWSVVTADNAGPFSIPASLNAVVRATTADVIVLTGADAQISADGLRKCVEAVSAGRAPWAMVADQMVRLGSVISEKALKTPVGSTLPQAPGSRRPCQLGWGVLVAQREVFERVTYDERLAIAWEDSAWGFAAATLYGEPYRLERTSVRLLWHPRVRRHRLDGYHEATVIMQQYQAAHAVKDQKRTKELLAQGRA
jgi:hypothetical protein